MLDHRHYGLAAGYVVVSVGAGFAAVWLATAIVRPGQDGLVSVWVWIGVALLGGVGAVARFVLDAAISARWDGDLPLGTLVINVSGAFVLGLLIGLDVMGNALLLAGRQRSALTPPSRPGCSRPTGSPSTARAGRRL